MVPSLAAFQVGLSNPLRLLLPTGNNKYYCFNFTDRDIEKKLILFQNHWILITRNPSPWGFWPHGIKNERDVLMEQIMKISLSCWQDEEAPNEKTWIQLSGLSYRVLPIVFSLYSLSSGPEDQTNERVGGKYFISGFH